MKPEYQYAKIELEELSAMAASSKLMVDRLNGYVIMVMDMMATIPAARAAFLLGGASAAFDVVLETCDAPRPEPAVVKFVTESINSAIENGARWWNRGP
jgi:hypothetical protein